MSEDEADPELLELLRQSLGLKKRNEDEISSDTVVLRDAEYVYNNAIDVSIDMHGTKAAAASIYLAMQERQYSTGTWSQHELHPTREEGFSDVDLVNFVFTIDLLNFSFWSDLSESQRFQVNYKDNRWTGYKSLLACLHRALGEGVPITTPRFWIDPTCTDDILKNVFRSATNEEIPLLQDRLDILRETGDVLSESFGEGEGNQETSQDKLNDDVPPNENRDGQVEGIADIVTSDERIVQPGDTPEVTLDNDSTSEAVEPPFHQPDTNSTVDATLGPTAEDTVAPAEIKAQSIPDYSVVRLIEKADRSAGKLVNLLVKHFTSFRDEARFDGRRVRFYKRAQIFVADLWAAFEGTGYGEFRDIEHLTMFADYRVPQMLHSLGVLTYSPPLNYAILDQKEIAPGHSWEVQLRGCSIWAVELIGREILRQHPEATEVNAVLVDFLLYDLAKEREASSCGRELSVISLQEKRWSVPVTAPETR